MTARNFFVTFVASVVMHAAAITLVVVLVINPLFVSFGVAVSLFLFLVLLISAVRAVRTGQKEMAAFWIGLLVAIGLLLGILTVMDWAVGTPPSQEVTVAGFARYLGQIRPALPVLAFYFLPFLFTFGASAAGHALGLWLRRRYPMSGYRARGYSPSR